jgi:hypothetical protein
MWIFQRTLDDIRALSDEELAGFQSGYRAIRIAAEEELARRQGKHVVSVITVVRGSGEPIVELPA